MNTTSRSKPSATARAEAAAWVARLHGPNRTPEVEAGLRRWMGEDPERAAAFELLTDTWEKSAHLRRAPVEEFRSWELPGFRISFSHAALATAATAILAVIGTIFFLHTDSLATDVGELRTLTLEDGTRVYLNTDTRVVPHYDKKMRRVELERGEALFEVAKNAHRPFIVTVGDHQIRALGTAFVVRRDAKNLAVTLVEGKVSVTPAVSVNTEPVLAKREYTSAPKGVGAQPQPTALILNPGERVTLRMAEPVLAIEAPARKDYAVDKPPIDRVTAWQRGQVSFDETSLADAVAEMNRYSKTRLVIEDAGTAAIRISGIFRAGDQENFARAIAKTYGLGAINHEQDIVLAVRMAAPE